MKLLKRFMLTGVLSALIGYFAFHALTGEQGHFAHQVIKKEIAAAKAELADTRARRHALEVRAARLDLDSGAFDVDYLEELAREKLHFAHPSEIVVTLDDAPAP